MFPMPCHCDVENDVELLLAGESVRIAVLLRTFFHSSWCAVFISKKILSLSSICVIIPQLTITDMLLISVVCRVNQVQLVSPELL